MTDTYYVYTWTRPDTDSVFYVGKGKGNRDASSKKHNPIFLNICDKLKRLGLDPIVVRLKDDLSENDAFALEKQEIAKHGRINNSTGTLANLTDGGEGKSGAIISVETKRRQSESLKIALSSPEARDKLSVAGRKRYEDPNERLRTSLAVTERYKDPKEREKMASSLRGVPKTKQHVDHVRQTLLETWQDPNLRIRHRSLALLRGPGKSNTSGYKGVSFDRSTGKWLAQIEVDGRNTHLGRHATAADAAKAYDVGAVRHYGDNVYLNFPADGEDQGAFSSFVSTDNDNARTGVKAA